MADECRAYTFTARKFFFPAWEFFRLQTGDAAFLPLNAVNVAVRRTAPSLESVFFGDVFEALSLFVSHARAWDTEFVSLLRRRKPAERNWPMQRRLRCPWQISCRSLQRHVVFSARILSFLREAVVQVAAFFPKLSKNDMVQN